MGVSLTQFIKLKSYQAVCQASAGISQQLMNNCISDKDNLVLFSFLNLKVQEYNLTEGKHHYIKTIEFPSSKLGHGIGMLWLLPRIRNACGLYKYFPGLYVANITDMVKVSNYDLTKTVYLDEAILRLSGRYGHIKEDTTKNQNFFFFSYFILKFLQATLSNQKLNLTLQKSSLSLVEKSAGYQLLARKLRRAKFLADGGVTASALLQLMATSLYTKDTVLLKNGLKAILEKLHFKDQKKFLYTMKQVIRVLFSSYYSVLNCSGIMLQIKGKIGVGGASKKRKYTIKFGRFSFSQKSQKLTYSQEIIKTYAGVLGFELYLSFK